MSFLSGWKRPPSPASAPVPRASRCAQVIYDGDCGFCRRAVGWIRRKAGARLNYVPRRSAPRAYKALSEKSVLFLDAQGKLSQGASAFFKIRALLGSPLWENYYLSCRLFAFLSDGTYRLISFLRPSLSVLLDFILGPPPEDL